MNEYQVGENQYKRIEEGDTIVINKKRYIVARIVQCVKHLPDGETGDNRRCNRLLLRTKTGKFWHQVYVRMNGMVDTFDWQTHDTSTATGRFKVEALLKSDAPRVSFIRNTRFDYSDKEGFDSLKAIDSRVLGFGAYNSGNRKTRYQQQIERERKK